MTSLVRYCFRHLITPKTNFETNSFCRLPLVDTPRDYDRISPGQNMFSIASSSGAAAAAPHIKRAITETDLSAQKLQLRVAQLCEGYENVSMLAATAPLSYGRGIDRKRSNNDLLEVAGLAAWREVRPSWLPPLPTFGYNDIHAEMAECNQVSYILLVIYLYLCFCK